MYYFFYMHGVSGLPRFVCLCKPTNYSTEFVGLPLTACTLSFNIIPHPEAQNYYSNSKTFFTTTRVQVVLIVACQDTVAY